MHNLCAISPGTYNSLAPADFFRSSCKWCSSRAIRSRSRIASIASPWYAESSS